MKRKGGRRPQERISLPKVNINEKIRAATVRLLDSDGEFLGIVDLKEAQEKASEAELDLVEIASQAEPPVCKIMNYSKYLFELKKKKLEAKKNQKQIVHKSIKFRPNTDKGDYEVKMKKINDFLEKGNHVKVIVWFRGREMAHQQLGTRLLNQVHEDLGENVNVQSEAKMEGRQMIMVISPSKV